MVITHASEFRLSTQYEFITACLVLSLNPIPAG